MWLTPRSQQPSIGQHREERENFPLSLAPRSNVSFPCFVFSIFFAFRLFPSPVHCVACLPRKTDDWKMEFSVWNEDDIQLPKYFVFGFAHFGESFSWENLNFASRTMWRLFLVVLVRWGNGQESMYKWGSFCKLRHIVNFLSQTFQSFDFVSCDAIYQEFIPIWPNWQVRPINMMKHRLCTIVYFETRYCKSTAN